MEAQIIKWIQSFSHPILDDVFQVVTMLGEELFIIVAMALIYWVFNKEMGKYLCYSLCVTLCVNGIIKSLVKAPRPIGEEGIRSLRVETADGYSFPSGHTQSSSTFFFSIACWIKKWWLFLIAAVLSLLVALSRLYLGVHWPRDVIAGLLLGIVLSALSYFLYRKVKNRLLLFGITLIPLLTGLFLPDLGHYVQSLGLYLGFALGVLFEERYVNFSVKGTALRKGLRFVLGALCLGVLKFTLDLLGDSIPVQLIEYTCISFFGLGIWPLIFTKLHL